MHSTDNLEDGYIGSGTRLWHSINYHGKENHSIEILEYLDDRKSLKYREKELIKEETLKDPMCMNLALGGEGGIRNKKHAKKFHKAGGRKVLQMMSKIHHNKLKSDVGYREKYCKSVSESLKGEKNPMFGKSHSIETKKKMSKSSNNKGQNNSQFGKRWITNGTENRKIDKFMDIPEGWSPGRKLK